jgi:hypothetical protein
VKIGFVFFGLLAALVMAQDSLPWQGVIVFDQRVRVDDAPGLSGHPAYHAQTIMDSTWTLFTVWADDRDNNGRFEVFFAASFDTARTWTANVNLSQNPSQYYVFPWLAVDRENLYVVWQAWRGNTWHVLFTHSSDRGSTWATPVDVPGITVVNDFNSGINFGPQPKLAIDSRSNPDTTFLYLLWADNATGKIQIKLGRSIDQGTSFADLGIVDKNPDNVNRNPYIAVDNDGRVHCAWALGTGGTNQDPHPNIGYTRSLDRGATFLAADIVVNDNLDGVYRGNPSMTCNPTGDVLISWEDSRRASGNTNPDIWFARVPRDSVAAGTNERVNWWVPDSGAKYDNYKPVIRMDPQGIMVAAWHDNPENASSYGIHMAAYSDSAHRFSTSQSLYQTFTGANSGSFGNNFYSPSLFVQAKVDSSGDTITHFFLVWQDFSEDSVGGNIYSVHGRVVKILGDLDVDNDSLGVVADTMRLRSWVPSPFPYPNKGLALGEFVLANTSVSYNPDTADGPSLSRIDSLTVRGTLTGPFGTLDSVTATNLPASLAQGQTTVCTLAVFVPEEMLDGEFAGPITITGRDSGGALIEETFYALFKKIGDLDIDNDSLDVVADTIRVKPRQDSVGPPPHYTEYAFGEFMLANTSEPYNPDTADGPSQSYLRYTGFDGVLTGPRGTIDSILVLNLPESLAQGQNVACTLAVYVPPDLPDGDYSGPIILFGYDSLDYKVADTVYALVTKLGDIDVDNDRLDVVHDTMDLRTQPAGPVYHPYAKARFMLVNTDISYNPDSLDGPSRSPLMITGFDAYFCSPQDTVDSIYIPNLPSYMEVGQAVECTLALVVPVGTPLDQYHGCVTINAYDTLGFRMRDSFRLGVRGPEFRQSLDSLRVAPIPFKPYQHPEHDAIHFQGLTKGARVIVYDASGQEVWRDTEKGDGHVAWKAEVASGIYAYLVVSADGKSSKVGKLSVIR